MNRFSKDTWYEMNIQKISCILHINNKLSKKEETLSFTIASKWIKLLGLNLTREVKDLYTEKSKTLIKEIKAVTNKWKNIWC